ncbi:ABC transporter permease [Turicibacter sanguinis]|uniref:ABC transporter permease n=1 Tax=Turicibacter sanguinis TaxID=154288 RepID=A0A6I3N9C1_9FIRM|nr:ABC transporter permease [Turicibacter sanguinis]MTK69208.1 ABC transporter permease [Turicibacter sanguinis]MTK79619.1 ABC transporter permease [Turicibacter sanguinis]MTK82553.1 ABC transporter permease [Turicibacter sanguinis]MTK85442.1 ABC transporter permease [Turicibacter sanguinis]MTK94084.1 ABC transporter permease [Turicibacter sanguinis]
MKQLIHSEFKRYFSKKSWLGVLGSIPFMIALMASQSLKANQIVTLDRVASFNTFALYTPLHKIFTFYLFAVVILLVVTTIASEYEKSEIRMVLIRGYSTRQVFFVKLMMIVLALFIFIVGYVACSYLVASVIFEHQSVISSFLSFDDLTSVQVFLMTLKYYGLLFLILAVFAMVIAFFAMFTKSVISTTVIGLLIVVASFGFYMVTQLVGRYISGIDINQLNLLALPLMQLKGAYQIVAGHTTSLHQSLTILGSYFILFMGSSYYLTGRQDQFI